METMALMSGVKGEKAHHLYKEEDGSHIEHVMICYVLIIWSIYTYKLSSLV